MTVTTRLEDALNGLSDHSHSLILILQVEDVSNLMGTNAKVTIEDNREGHLSLCPIPGDTLATVANVAQVSDMRLFTHLSLYCSKCNNLWLTWMG